MSPGSMAEWIAVQLDYALKVAAGRARMGIDIQRILEVRRAYVAGSELAEYQPQRWRRDWV